RTDFCSGSTFPQVKRCSMLLVEQGGQRCAWPPAPAVLLSALTFTDRRFRRQVPFQHGAASPRAPAFIPETLPGRCHFLTPASRRSPVSTQSTIFSTGYGSLRSGPGC